MQPSAREAEEVGASKLRKPGANMSSSQMIIVAVLSLAVVALLMVRQGQTD
jgi:hypothetical protein